MAQCVLCVWSQVGSQVSGLAVGWVLDMGAGEAAGAPAREGRAGHWE